jgi:hypothetical protein
MKQIVVVTARILLGLLFTFAGAAGFAFTFHAPPPPPGLAGLFVTVFFQSHWALLVNAVELLGGVLLLFNRFVPLALVLLAGVIVNILTFHITMMPLGIGPGLVATMLWFIVALPLRDYFAPLLTAKVP